MFYSRASILAWTLNSQVILLSEKYRTVSLLIERVGSVLYRKGKNGAGGTT